MKFDHETQRQIAQAILKAYHVHPSVSNQFRKGTKNHRLYYSERTSAMFPAVLYYLDNDPKYERIARDFEKKTGCMVFHATLTHTEFGDLLDLLYVPNDSEYIDAFLTDSQQGYFLSYCYNLDSGEAELGTIRVRPRMGGIERYE